MTKVTYHQKPTYCHKATCKKCQAGIGHGPYWFAYETKNGKQTQTYLGKHLPPEVAQTVARTLAPSVTGRRHARPLVGRMQECTLLQRLLEAIEQKHVDMPHTLLLTGEAGMGKTRLAEEISRDAQLRGWRVLWGRGYSQESDITYHIWTDLLRKALESKKQQDELRKRPTLYQPLCTLLPELYDTFSDVFSKDYAPLPVAEQKQCLWSAIYELLLTISTAVPLLMILDDLHWFDDSSCELFAYLARRLLNRPIIFIGTYREHEATSNDALQPLIAELQREQAITMLSVGPLSNDHISTLVVQILSERDETEGVPLEKLTTFIQERTAGNPFFAEELARVSSIIPSTTSGQLLLPTSITAVLDLRLARLSESCQKLLGKAAVVGTSFDFSLLAALEAQTTGSHEEAVLDMLEEALEAGLLNEECVQGQIIYQFWHPLLVNYLYEKLSAARRVNLHRRIAGILREWYKEREKEGAATITQHLLRGNAPADLVAHYAELAAQHAYTLSAYADAEHFYLLALASLSQTPRKIVLDSTGVIAQKALLLECVGEVMRIQGKAYDARRVYEQALHLHEQCNTASDSLYEVQIQALLCCEIGLTCYDIGNLTEADHWYQRGENILQARQILAGPVWARLYYERSYLKWRRGNYEEALLLARHSLALFQQSLASVQTAATLEKKLHFDLTRLRRTIAGNVIDLGRAHTLVGLIALALGQTTETAQHLQTAIDMYEQHEQRRELAIGCCHLGDLYLRQAQYQQAQDLFYRSRTVAEQVGDLPLTAFVTGNLGITHLRMGHLSQASHELQQAATLAAQLHDLASASLWLTYQASVLQEQGNLHNGKSLLLQASRYSHLHKGQLLIAIARMRLAQALEHHEAEEHLFLLRAQKTVEHVLRLDNLEADTRTEAKILFAQILLACRNSVKAQQLSTQALEEAQQCGFSWLSARAFYVLGNIHLLEHQTSKTNPFFEKALALCQQDALHLDAIVIQRLYDRLLSVNLESTGAETLS